MSVGRDERSFTMSSYGSMEERRFSAGPDARPGNVDSAHEAREMLNAKRRAASMITSELKEVDSWSTMSSAAHAVGSFGGGGGGAVSLNSGTTVTGSPRKPMELEEAKHEHRGDHDKHEGIKKSSSFSFLLRPSNSFFYRARKRRQLRKYYKVLSRDSEFVNARNIYLAKFALSADDDLAIALLCASELEAAVMILGARLIPLVVVALIAVALLHMKSYPGIEYISQTATWVDIAIGCLAIGCLVFAQLLGPLTRPFSDIRKFARLRSVLSEESAGMWWRLWVGEISLLLKSVSTLAIVAASVSCSLLCQTSIIGFLWTTLAIAWLQMLDQLLIIEIVGRFYANCTLTMAASDVQWPDADTALEFWRHSWISKENIRKELRDLEVSSTTKWNLLTDDSKGLGLGATGDRTPVQVTMEIQLIKWSKINQKDVANLGPVLARSVQRSEWLYSMSPDQRKWFFQHYPIKASTLPWGGSVRLDMGYFELEHTSGLVRVLEAKANDDCDHLTELYLHNNGIDDEQASVIADVLRKNRTLKKLWMFHNNIGDAGAINLAKMIRENQSLRTMHLRGNAIGDSGAVEIAAALEENKTLEVLGVDRNLIGTRGATRIVESLLRNRTLRRLWICENDYDLHLLDETVRQLHLTTRVKLRAHMSLPPVIKSLVRTRLEELKLSREEWSQAKRYLDHWNAALRATPNLDDANEDSNNVQPHEGHHHNRCSRNGELVHGVDDLHLRMYNGMKCESSLNDLEIGATNEVNAVVKDILQQLPHVTKAEWRHRVEALKNGTTAKPLDKKHECRGRKLGRKFRSMPVTRARV